MKISTFSMKDLLTAGAHYGHIREKYNPKMEPFIFGLRDGLHLIDLEKTVVALSSALDFMLEAKKQGKQILFVCTKSGFKDMTREMAESINMPYVVDRWPGGMLTNFATLKKQIEKLRNLETRLETPEFTELSKKDKSMMKKEIERLNKSFGGIKKLLKTPDVIFVIDTIKEKTALAEARTLKLPVVALVDTNSDPRQIDFPIPMNDDAKKGIELVLGEIGEALK